MNKKSYKKIYLRKKKVCIFQDLNQGPLDPKLLTLPLDHEVSSEDRKKNFQGHCAVQSGYGGRFKNSKVVEFEAVF